MALLIRDLGVAASQILCHAQLARCCGQGCRFLCPMGIVIACWRNGPFVYALYGLPEVDLLALPRGPLLACTTDQDGKEGQPRRRGPGWKRCRELDQAHVAGRVRRGLCVWQKLRFFCVRVLINPQLLRPGKYGAACFAHP
jgi:hypothetical protein